MHKDPEQRVPIYNQYKQIYGELAESGKFRVGESVLFDEGTGLGEVLWKYINDEGVLQYVLDDQSGFPVEVSAQEVREP